MRRSIPYQRSLLCAAISMSLIPLASTSFAQEAEVEEVVVTGSYIRRSEGFTGASAITQLSADDLIDEGTLNIGEVVQNLSFVNGAASAITNTIQGTSSRTTSIDLRGLGARSTLTLLDGKRLVNENVNSLIPTIAIQRLDIVADGAAALYGNEAVAGVVNFVPYKSFEGLKIDTYAEQDSRGDYDQESAQFLWGGSMGDLDVVLAGQYNENSRLGWDEREYLANAGLVVSSNAPGNWRSPQRDANGQYTGAYANTVDPACAPASARTGYKVDEANNKFGNRLGSNCYFDFGDTRSYREPMQTGQLFTNITYDVSEDLTLTLQGFHTRLAETSYTSTSNPGNSRIGELPAVRGEIPGNPFRAVTSAGIPLFGVDTNGDGIPDRGTMDRNNDKTFDYIVSGTTPNGVPLYEDVLARTLRPINKTHTRPAGHTRDMDNISRSADVTTRVSLQADFTVPYVEGWEGSASYTRNREDLSFMSNQNYDITAMQQGLNCDVANDRKSCYNPFMVTDEANNNTVAVMDAIAARDKEWSYDQLDVYEVILNGELPTFDYELPGGPIGMAVGYQRRSDKYTNIPSAVELSGDTWIGGTEKEVVTTGSRDVDAYFMELAVPILTNLELELAVRREEFSTGQQSTDPKYGITWGATDWLTLRATQGDAFIAPSLSQLLNPITCGLSTVTDRFGPYSAFTTACGGGNPNLENEIATSKQLGFDIALGGFDLNVTWNKTDFENRIIGINGQDLMTLDFQNFKSATGFGGSGVGAGNQPSLAQLQAWVADPRSNKDIIRDPQDLYTILQVDNTSTTNAESVSVEAYDINGTYRFSVRDWGDFRVNLQATYIDHFYYQNDPTQPVVDGAGKYNDPTSAAPELPQIKANLRLGWTRGNHSISSTVHYIDDMPYDGPLFTHIDFFGGTNRPAGITTVRAWTDMDLSYTYRGLEFLGGEAAFSIGSRNLFDRQAQRSPEFAGVMGGLQDPMGRVIYARFVYDLQ